MTADLLVIVPTKGRTHLIPRLLAAIKNTTTEPVDVLLVVNRSQFYDYDGVTNLSTSIMVVGDEYTYPMKLNAAAAEHAFSYRYLALWNDDHEPITPGWDTAMKRAISNDPFGVAYGPDGVWEEGQVPTAPMITSSMHEALGWIALPGLFHILVDNVWMDLAKATGTLHFLPNVRIQHHHLDNGEAPMDATYQETQNDQVKNQQDREAWWAWMGSSEDGIQPDSQADIDVRKLLELWT